MCAVVVPTRTIQPPPAQQHQAVQVLATGIIGTVDITPLMVAVGVPVNTMQPTRHHRRRPPATVSANVAYRHLEVHMLSGVLPSVVVQQTRANQPAALSTRVAVVFTQITLIALRLRHVPLPIEKNHHYSWWWASSACFFRKMSSKHRSTLDRHTFSSRHPFSV